MQSVDLKGGSYKAKSIIAGAQRVVNLYPERNEPGAPAPYTYYDRPGLRRVLNHGAASRCLYRATNGELFEVVGTEVYFVSSLFTATFLGFVAAGTTNCSMSDNGTVILLVDGTAAGYTINLATHAYAAIADAAFYGSTRSEYMDSCLLYTSPSPRDLSTSRMPSSA